MTLYMNWTDKQIQKNRWGFPYLNTQQFIGILDKKRAKLGKNQTPAQDAISQDQNTLRMQVHSSPRGTQQSTS